MTSTTARVAAVNTLPLGSILTSAAALGATTLAVEDAADFDAAGGVVIIGDTEIATFVSADDEAGTLALAAPTAAAWDVDTRVELWDATAGTRVVETVAQVLVEGTEQGGDSLEAIIDHTLIPFLPEGIRETDPETGLVGEAVAIEWRGEELVVVNIIGQAPVMDGSVIDPDTLPPSGGPVPEEPNAPGAPTITPGFGALMLRWAPVVHPNPVVYEVHVSTATPVVPSASTLAGELVGTAMTVRSFGTPETTLAYGTTYYVALIAKDSVDETFASALGPEASGAPVQVPSAAIDEAVTDAIAEAQNDADSAQATADGKNKITYGATAPTATTAGRPGDIFWVRSGSTITAQYLCTAGTGAPTGNTWAAQTLTNATISTLDAGKVTTGTLSAARIAAKSMTLDKLLIASTENLLINPDFGIGTGAPAGWSGGNSTVVSVSDGPDSVAANVLRVTPLTADEGTTNDAYKLTSNGTVVEHGKSYRFTMRARLVSGTAGLLRIRAGLYRAGAANSWPTVTESLDASAATAGAWVTLTGTLTMPATHDKLSVTIHTSAAAGSVFEVADVSMRPMADASLVVDGSITARALAVDSVTADQISAGSITGEAFAGELLLGSRITTAETGQRVEMDTNGLRLFNSAEELRVNLPTDPAEDPSFRGRVEADGLTVRQGASFFSTLNEFAKDSKISLAEQVAAPVAAPQVGSFWEFVTQSTTARTGSLGTFSFDAQSISSATYLPAWNAFAFIQRVPSGGSRVWYMNLDGTYNNLWDLPADWKVTSGGIGTDGEWRFMLLFEPNGEWYIYDYSQPSAPFRKYVRQNTSREPQLAMDGNNVWVVESFSDGPKFYRMTMTSPAGGTTIAQTVNSSGTPVGGQIANSPWTFLKLNADFGSTRFVVSYQGTSTFRVYNSSGVHQPAETWSPPAAKATGFWDPTVSRFRTLGLDNRAYRHSALTWTDSALDTWHLGQTFYDGQATGGTHETTIGAIRTFQPLKRSWVRITPTQVPYTGGTDDPNNARIYGKTGAAPPANGAGMYLQETMAYSTPIRDRSVLLVTSGATPPTTSNFPGANPARLVSARTLPSNGTQPILDLRGDGSGTWGTLRVNGSGVPQPLIDWTATGVTAGAGVSLDNVQYMVDALGRVNWRGGIYASTTPASNDVVLTIPAAIAPASRMSWEVGGLTGTLLLYVGVYGGSGSSNLAEIRFRRVSSGSFGSGSATSSSLAGLFWTITPTP